MDLETTFIDKIITLIKLPIVTAVKIMLFILNIIPLKVYEVHGARGTNQSCRPDLRAIYVLIKGKRKLHLGSFIIAWCRGMIFKAPLNTKGAYCWGIMSEDYIDIQNKWTF